MKLTQSGAWLALAFAVVGCTSDVSSVLEQITTSADPQASRGPVRLRRSPAVL